MSVLTSILGLVFLIGQVLGAIQLGKEGVRLSGNPSGSFVYILAGVHAVHLVSAFILVLFVLVNSFRFKNSRKYLLQIELCTTYWHFLGVLWLYLFVFLLLLR